MIFLSHQLTWNTYIAMGVPCCNVDSWRDANPCHAGTHQLDQEKCLTLISVHINDMNSHWENTHQFVQVGYLWWWFCIERSSVSYEPNSQHNWWHSSNTSIQYHGLLWVLGMRFFLSVDLSSVCECTNIWGSMNSLCRLHIKLRLLTGLIGLVLKDDFSPRVRKVAPYLV